MSLFYPYEFEAPIEMFGVGKTRKIWYKVLFLPEGIKAKLPFNQYPRLRIDGEIADIPVANAFIPTGDGQFYVIVAPDILKQAGAQIGDTVSMRFRIADQDHVDVPPALKAALERKQQNRDAWDNLTPGKQRMLAQHVLSAKPDPTREKRISEAMEALLHHKADLRAWRKARR